jgi:nicotinamide riboside kinase
MKIALLGAESTGKSQLARELAAHLREQGKTAEAVPEVLRDWCTREGREPRPEEQLPIAREQEARVDAAALRAGIVVADTTALIVAIYSGMPQDSELHRFALEHQRGYDITLLCALDLPWVPDGLQRMGPEVRESVDGQIRSMLEQARLPYRLVYGSGAERLRNALAAIDSASPEERNAAMAAGRRWTWSCEKCSDPECEHRLFTGLSGSPGAGRRAR